MGLFMRYNDGMILYFTRHGESEWNLVHRVQGRHDSPLTPRGEQMALRLRKRLRGLPFTRVLTSPLGRARRTAELLAEDTGIIPEPDERICEVNLGVMEDQIMEELPPEMLRRFYHEPQNYFPEGGEGYPAAFERVSRLMRELETEDGCVLLVAHALILRLIRLYLLDLPLDNMMDVHTAGCCFCEARYSAGRWELVSFADDRCQSPDYDPERFAYFGSPCRVDSIPQDAVLTPYSEVASAYAHSPRHINIALNGIVSHDGTGEGFLYQVDLSDRSVRLVGPAPAARVDGPAYL